MEFIWFLIIGLVAGFIASLIVRGSGMGMFIDVLLGVAGAFVGGWIFRLLGFTTENGWSSLITATIGAVIVLAITGAIQYWQNTHHGGGLHTTRHI